MSRSRDLEPGMNSTYFKSRLKAFAYSSLFSVQFEIVLMSEGTVGHATSTRYSRHPFSDVDIAITPTVGTALLIGEDLLDRYVVRYVESKTTNRLLRSIVRGFLNPTRSFANLLRFKKPRYRENRPL